MAAETAVSFIPMACISEVGFMEVEETRILEDVKAGYTFFRNGDVVIAKITPCFENGKGAIARNLVNAIGFGTTELFVLRPSAGVDERFLYYFTASDYFRRTGAGLMYGAGGQKRIPDSLILDIPFPAITRSQQANIADFLDRETAEADALIANYERLIKLLEENRAAFIMQAVTKGLELGAPMKNSGSAFIGNVPAHWTVSSLRRLASVRGGTAVPEEYLTDDETAIPFFKVGDIESAGADGVMRLARSFVRRNAARYDAANKFPVNTIVLAKRGAALLLNRFRLTGQDAFFDSNLMGLKVDTSKLHLRFALHVLSIIDLSQFVKPGVIPSIDAPEIKNQVIALPPILEQTQIADHIDTWIRSIAIEISLVQRAIALVKEHRSAVITAAVTGSMDVNIYCANTQSMDAPV